MADGPQHRLASMQPEGAPTEDEDSVTTACPEMDREMPGQAEAALPAPQRPREKSLGGLVQQFEQAVGDFQQVLTPGAAGSPDKFPTFSTLLGSSPASPVYTASPGSSIFPGIRPTSPGVRVTGNDKAHVELVTEDVLDARIAQLTHAMHAQLAHAIHEELASLEARLQSSFEALGARCAALEKRDGEHAQELTSLESRLHEALGARCAALEKKGGEQAQDLERYGHHQRALAERVDGLQRQSAEQDKRVAQELEQLGHTSGQALDSLRLVGPRLDKMAQGHRDSVEALELANQQLVKRLETFAEQTNLLHDARKAHEQECKLLQQQVKDMFSQIQQVSEQDTRLAQHVDTEMERLEGMLHGPAPSVESDLQKIFQDMEDFKGKLHVLNQVQIQDQNDFNEVDQFQKELSQRVNDEMRLLRGKVDEVTDMVQEDLMGLHGKLCTDLENLQADREAAPRVFGLPSPGIGAVIVEEPPAPEEAVDDDDCRWELQHKALEIETATNEGHPEVTENEQRARVPRGEQPPEHGEVPPKVIGGSPPPLGGGSLMARLEPQRASTIFQNTLPAEVTGEALPPPSPKPATLGLAELQRKMDQKLDMSLRHMDEFITRHEVQLQQMGDIGSRCSGLQRCVDDLREEIGTVRGNLDVLRTCKVLTHLRAIPDL